MEVNSVSTNSRGSADERTYVRILLGFDADVAIFQQDRNYLSIFILLLQLLNQYSMWPPRSGEYAYEINENRSVQQKARDDEMYGEGCNQA